MGIVADNPDCKIKLKVFHNEIQNDHAAIKLEEGNYKPIPVIAEVSEEDIQENYRKIKQDIDDLFNSELKKLDNMLPNEEQGVSEAKTIGDDLDDDSSCNSPGLSM